MPSLGTFLLVLLGFVVALSGVLVWLTADVTIGTKPVFVGALISGFGVLIILLALVR